MGSPGGSVVEHLPLAQGMILEAQDRVPHRAPCMEPASPSAFVSASKRHTHTEKEVTDYWFLILRKCWHIPPCPVPTLTAHKMEPIIIHQSNDIKVFQRVIYKKKWHTYSYLYESNSPRTLCLRLQKVFFQSIFINNMLALRDLLIYYNVVILIGILPKNIHLHGNNSVKTDKSNLIFRPESRSTLYVSNCS